MLDTNALLSVAFSMIANFTNVVPVPPSSAPIQPRDVERCVVGGPVSPVDLYLVTRQGVEFWIGHGIVYGYSHPSSFFGLQEPALVPLFVGTTSVNSNKIVQIALNALRPLIKSGDPLDDGPLNFESAGKYEGQTIPYFRLTWPKSSPGSSRSAKVEIDGRSGTVVDMQLFDPRFWDAAFEKTMKEQVHAPNQLRSKPLSRLPPSPKPTTNQVDQAIRNWLDFCERFGLDPGRLTNISDVDWDRTFLCKREDVVFITNRVHYPLPPVCRITFKGGAYFDSIEGATVSYCCADATFPEDGRPRSWNEWTQFEGEGGRRWEDLARDFQIRVSEKLSLPPSCFEQAPPKLSSPVEARVNRKLRGVLVRWPRSGLREDDIDPTVAGMQSLMTVEFDLNSGQAKRLEFSMPELTPPIWQGLLARRAKP